MARKMKTMDGNHAAAHASYAFTDVAAIYPITPSSVMAEATDDVGNTGKKEHIRTDLCRLLRCSLRPGAAGTVHGSLAAGALTTYIYRVSGLTADDPQPV